MRKLIDKIKLFFNPQLLRVVSLSTGVICKHYRYWNKEVIHVEHPIQNRMWILNEEFWVFDENDRVCNAWTRMDSEYLAPNTHTESYFKFKRSQMDLTKDQMIFCDRDPEDMYDSDHIFEADVD